MQTQTYIPITNKKTIDQRVDDILNSIDLGKESEEMKKYVKTKLGEQIVQRTLLEMLKDIPQDKFSAFLEFIDKNASQNSLYVYLSAIYPDAEKVIISKAEEVIKEFESDL
jgi:hypothetical protein